MPELTIIQRWNIRLLARNGSVLKLLNILGRPAGSVEIAATLGVSTPTARRRLMDLEGLGFVEFSPDTGCYSACADFDALLAGEAPPASGPAGAEAAPLEILEPPAAPQPIAETLAVPEPCAGEVDPARVESQKFPVQGRKNFFPPNAAVVAVKYLINLYRGLTTTTTAPPGGKIFPSARAPASGTLLVAHADRPPRAHAPPGPVVIQPDLASLALTGEPVGGGGGAGGVAGFSRWSL